LIQIGDTESFGFDEAFGERCGERWGEWLLRVGESGRRNWSFAGVCGDLPAGDLPAGDFPAGEREAWAPSMGFGGGNA